MTDGVNEYWPSADQWYVPNVSYHERRADMWIAQGYPDRAARSMQKAAKWRERQRRLDIGREGYNPPSKPQAVMREYVEIASKAMQEQYEKLVFG